MSDVEHTYVDTNGGLGGPALGAGFGGMEMDLEVVTIILMLLISSVLFSLKL